MKPKTLARRDLLSKAAQLAALGIAAPLVVACSGKKELDCTDVSQLATADKQLRTSLKYVQKSSHGEAKNCANCNFFKAVPDACGTCTLVKGPINPAGYCTSWAAKA